MTTSADGRLRQLPISSISAALAAVFSAGVSAPTIAQQINELEEVVVTGSRIRRQDFVANSPIVTVDSDTFANTSVVGIETVLNQLPQFVPAAQTEFTETTLQATATETPGASHIDLRGLGSFRTLTLIDGRRAQPLNASLAVDTNSIPSAAIERVEIISGGASAVYGADAVAGVVNFILKDDYEGMDFTARWGSTEEGDAEQMQISALLGANFADDRGNVMLGVEHASRGMSFDTEREWILSDLRNPNIGGGLLSETYIDFARTPTNLPSQAAIDSIFTELPGEDCVLPNGTGELCQEPIPNGKYFVNRTPDGTGTVFTGGDGFFGTNGAAGSYRYAGPFEHPDYPGLPYRKRGADNVIYEQFENIRAINSVPLERYSLFSKAQFEFAENLTAYLRGNFATMRTETKTSFVPAVNNWGAPIPVGFEGTVWEDSLLEDGTTNPAYLPGGAYGVNCPATGGCTESQAFPLPPELELLMRSRPDPNEDVRVHRVGDWFGERATRNRVATSQVTLGLEGELGNEWVWDTSVTYGQSDTSTLSDGVGDTRQYFDLIAAPNYGVNYQALGISPTSSGRGQCTSGLPIFRDIEVTQDCIETMTLNMQATGTLEQRMAEVNLAGDAWELPAGPMQFAMGLHYRDYSFNYVNDHVNGPFTYVTQALGLFPQGNTDAGMDTREFYGELLIPLARDLPLMQHFNIEIGGRSSDYTTAGSVGTYKFLVDWAPTPWARVRGGVNRATRAPHIAEAFLGRSQDFVSFSGDPCSPNDQELDYSANPIRNPEIAPQVEALCRSLMTETAATRWFETTPVNQLPASGAGAGGTAYIRGNPNIGVETADTLTLGLVLNSTSDSPWLSGLTTTIDYYQIEIEDLIGTQSGDEVWRNCIFSFDADSLACEPVFRDPFDGRLTIVEISYTNRARLEFSGVDVQLDWTFDFGQFDGFLNNIPGGLNVSTQITVPLDRTTQDGPDAPVRDWLGTTGCLEDIDCSAYDFQAFTTFNYFTGPWSASLRWNHYPTIEPAVAATNPDTRSRGIFEDYDVLSLSGSYRMSDRYVIRAGVDNLFDTEPPLSGGDFAADGGFVNQQNPPDLPEPATRTGDSRYDQYGRRFYVGVQVSF